jgi:hypothetical protein
LRGRPNRKVVFQSAFGCLTEVPSSSKDSVIIPSNFGVTFDWLKDGKSGLFFQVFVEDSEIFRRGNADWRVSDITIGEKVEMIGRDERSKVACVALISQTGRNGSSCKSGSAAKSCKLVNMWIG